LIDDNASLETEEAIELAHPLRVASREVVVHRDEMDAFAFERIEIDRQRRDERLSLARLHLADHSFVEDHPSDQLHVVVAHLERALARLTTYRKGLDEDVIERRSVFELLFEFARLRLERAVF